MKIFNLRPKLSKDDWAIEAILKYGPRAFLKALLVNGVSVNIEINDLTDNECELIARNIVIVIKQKENQANDPA